MSAALIRFPARGAPTSIARAAQPQASIENPTTSLYQALAGLMAASGVSVTPDSAMRCAAVYACVRVLSESIAQLPIGVYRRRKEGGSDEAPEHPLWAILHDAPNDVHTSFEWRELMQGHVTLRGNAFAYISRAGERILELLPLHPERVRVEQLRDFSLRYHVRGATEPLTAREILHIPGLSFDGVVGMSPIAQAREAIGLAIAAEDHGARLFGNGATPGGVLTHPNTLSEEAANRLKESWQAAYTGSGKFKTALLEEGLKWEKMGMTSEDAQFLETRKYQRAEIASIFRIPPHLIGDLERATFSNIEQQSLEFVVHSLMPWLKRWEQRLNKALLSERERPEYFIKFRVEGLLRGDIKTRYEAYQIAVTNGWLTRNEIRLLEDLNPAAGLDEFLRPLNMTPGSQPQPPKEK